MIYLDYNATAPLSKSALHAMQELAGKPLNASSVHEAGRIARAKIEDARRKILSYLGADERKQLVFTASGTEANNLALKGVGAVPVAVSATEHVSVLDVIENAYHIPVDQQGALDMEALECWLKNNKGGLVSVMLANNETGVIQPIKKISELVHAYDGVMHTDAVQAFKRLPINISDLGVDMMTISSHKCGGPLGGAALVLPKSLELDPLFKGGGQEQNIRPGTENVPSIVGLASIVDDAYPCDTIGRLRDELETNIVNIAPDAVIVAKDAERLDNTSCIIMPGVDNQTQLIAYDVDGICVSAGSACSSGKVTIPHVLTAMGYNKTLSSCAIRVSLGASTSEDDIEAFTSSFKRLYDRTRT